MAASYASGSYTHTSSTPVTGLPATIAMWMKASSASRLGAIGTTASSNNISLRVNSSDAQTLEVNQTGAQGTVSGNINDSVWRHIAGVFTSNTSRTAYRDGVAGTTNTTSATGPSGWDKIAIKSQFNFSFDASGASEVAEFAVWGVALTADEVASLAKGFSPKRIRPQSLVFYVPATRALADYFRNGLALTTVGSPTVTDNPRIY